MSGTTINPYRFGGQLGYRRDGTNRNYVRARHLGTATGRWISRDLIPLADAGFNFYWYTRNNPINLFDPSGLLALSGCEQRTITYCNSARKTKEQAENCFCRVSDLLCNGFINNPDIDPRVRLLVNCLNKCLFDHWQKRDTYRWYQAGCSCSQPKSDAYSCCTYMVAAEQNGFTDCLKNGPCKQYATVPLPGGLLGILFPFNGTEAQRIAAAQRDCCGGADVGSPISPGDPIGIPHIQSNV